MKKLFFLILFLFINNSYAKNPKYIFYFIGDGMGISHIALTEAYLNKTQNLEMGNRVLSFTSFPVFGLAKTYCSNRFITDSAAAGTALATGNKTNVGAISMNPSGEKLTSFAKIAKTKGKKIGIITTTNINDATPSVFYANQKRRSMLFEIAKEMSESDFDYFAGGGFKNDENNLALNMLKDRGYKITNNREDFLKLSKKDGKIYARCPRLDEQDACMFSIDQNGSDINLSEFVEKGIQVLNNKKGFFIMAEGGKIDWAAHANDAFTVINEVVDFSDAVAKAVEFYNKHPKDTLIVVTSDHETGGLGLGYYDTKYESYFQKLKNQKISKDEFLKLYAKLKTQKKAKLTFDIALSLVKDSFGIGSEELYLSKEDLQKLKQSFNLSYRLSKTNKKSDYNEDLFVSEAVKLLNNKAGIGWTTGSHTGTPVAVFAIGVGSKHFDSYIDNTDIANGLIKLLNK